jgi:hypothetical protein
MLLTGDVMTIYKNLTDHFSYFFGVNPQDARLDFSKVFDCFTPYHHKALEGLSNHYQEKLYRGLNYFDLEFLDGLAWNLRDQYELERKLEDAFIDGKIKETILLKENANNLYHEYLLLKEEILKDEDSKISFLESVEDYND